MIKTILTIALLATIASGCEEFTVDDRISSRYRSLSRYEWNRTPVLRGFDYNGCRGLVKEHTYIRNGQRYKAWVTFEDNCDGGNIYGILMSKGKIVAHIYDSGYVCRKDWREGV